MIWIRSARRITQDIDAEKSISDRFNNLIHRVLVDSTEINLEIQFEKSSSISYI